VTFDSVGLVKVLHRLEPRHYWSWKTLGGAQILRSSSRVNPVADDLDSEIERFRAKIDAGAQFAMPALFYPEHWYALVQKLGGKPPIPCSIGIWPLNSYITRKLCVWNNEVPASSFLNHV